MKRNKKKRLKYGELTDLILEAIANGLIEEWRGYPRGFRLPLVLGYLTKYILQIRKAKIKEEKIKKAVNNLKERNILYIEKKDNTTYVYVEEKGERKVIKHSLKLLLDFKRKEKKWDGRFFIVFFDVPENERIKRDNLRKFLKQLGFYPYQKSVYIFPYECEKEVGEIKKIVEGAKYMKYIIAEKIEDEAVIKRFFKLK